MSVLVDKNTRLAVQGITGNTGGFHTRQCMEYGTNVVAGVTPGKGCQMFEGKVPVFDTVAEARQQTGCNVSVIFVPAAGAADGILEAVDAGVELVICITEGIPVMDMMRVKAQMAGQPSRLILDADRYAEADEMLSRVARGQRVDHFETVRRAKDGHQVIVSLTVSPIALPSGEIVGAAEIARDVTERQRLERDANHFAAIVASSDYMKVVPDGLSPWLGARLNTLGTDGFGRSEIREHLRKFFEISAEAIAQAALSALARTGAVDPHRAEAAIAELGFNQDQPDPARL